MLTRGREKWSIFVWTVFVIDTHANITAQREKSICVYLVTSIKLQPNNKKNKYYFKQ